jgi:hypothetical protein
MRRQFDGGTKTTHKGLRRQRLKKVLANLLGDCYSFVMLSARRARLVIIQGKFPAQNPPHLSQGMTK